MNWYNFSWTVYYASIGSVLIPIVAFLSSRKRSRLRIIIFILLLASLASDVGNWIYVIRGNQGYLIINIFFACQITLLCFAYTNMLRPKVVAKVAMVAFPIVAV